MIMRTTPDNSPGNIDGPYVVIAANLSYRRTNSN